MASHGMSKTPIWCCWMNMRARCKYKRNTHYKYYGGRGIKVCKRWENSFENFYKDMGDMPEGYSIERIDVNKNYTPSNCCWIPKSEQVHNRRCNVKITFKGKTMNASQWDDEFGFPKKTVLYRHKNGLPIDAPLRDVGKKLITYKGKSMTCVQWDEYLGHPYRTTSRRLHDGVPIDKPLQPKDTMIKFKGKTKSASDWDKYFGFPDRTTYRRHRKGIPIDRPLRKDKRR